MTVLFDDKLRPITTKIAYIKADINLIIKEFVNWQTPLISEFNNTFSILKIKDDFKKTLLHLCPLTTAERRRYLFLPTQSEWVAFFDNGHTGTDRTVPEVISKNLKAECVYISYDSTTEETLFDYYKEIDNNEVDLFRSIAIIKEGGWKFYQYGNPLSFEKQENYKIRQIKSRFNLKILSEYLKKLNINAFDESYYNTSTEAILLDKQGSKFENTKELTLQQAQSFFI